MCHDAKSWSLDIQAASCYWFYQDIVTLSGHETPGNMTCVTDGLLLLSDDRFIPDRSCWLTVHNSWQSRKVVMEKGSIQIFRFSVIQFFCWASESCFCPECSAWIFGLNDIGTWSIEPDISICWYMGPVVRLIWKCYHISQLPLKTIHCAWRINVIIVAWLWPFVSINIECHENEFSSARF